MSTDRTGTLVATAAAAAIVGDAQRLAEAAVGLAMADLDRRPPRLEGGAVDVRGLCAQWDALGNAALRTPPLILDDEGDRP